MTLHIGYSYYYYKYQKKQSNNQFSSQQMLNLCISIMKILQITQIFYFCDFVYRKKLSAFHVISHQIIKQIFFVQPMTIKLFIDYMSQPSRAVLVLCLINNIPHQVVQTRIGQMQNRTPQFTKINPAQKVPAIFDTDSNLSLAESHAIMRYLCTKFKVPQHWYPSQDLNRRAKIDQYLDYHHTNTRKTAFYIFNKVIKVSLGLPTQSFNQQKAIKSYEEVYDFIEQNYLKDTQFLVGDKISIADLSAYEEIQSLYLTNTSFEKWPKLNKWMKKISEIPQVSQVDKIYYKVADKIKQKFLNPKL